MPEQREEEIVREYLKRKGYSENTIKTIMFPSKNIKKYTKEEVSNALAIHTLSGKAYEAMRKNNMVNIPLPHPQTLTNYVKHFICAPGIQSEFFTMLGAKMSSEDWIGRQSVLVFDEMHVKEVFEYDNRLKKLMGAHRTVQVVMLRYIIIILTHKLWHL